MFFQVIELLVLFSSILNVSSGSFLENGRVKRSDIDLQTCIDNFNIHRDKIIRTQDSQNMGAKYLNEIDLGSREECLRLCCETDNCDVFVFEEKNSGSCYLFHCGPPEDFKCKFTHHVNYSSAVLSINRHLPDLESQIKLTKHEQDLTKLRKPEGEPEPLRPVAVEVRTTPSTTTTTVASKEVIPISKAKEPGEARKCSRFQFECRSTGECIAIYNACDGIPQCADGSDEAPELGCPESATTSLPPPAILNNPVAPIRYDTNIQPPSIPQINSNAQPLYRPPVPREPPQLPPPVAHPDADFIRPINDPTNVNSRPPYDSQQLQPYVQQLPVQGQTNWIPHQSNQMPPQVQQYTDKNSHIFNHKESGLQVPDGQEIRYNKYKGAMQYLHRALGYSGGGGQVQYTETMNGRDYANKVPNYYEGNNYRQPIQQENWPAADGVRYSDSQRYPQENAPVQDQTSKQTNYKSTPIQDTNNIRTDTVNPKHVQEKLAHDLKHSKDNMEHGNVETIKIKKHPHHEEYPDVVAYKITDSSDLQDGFSQTPRGAVLSVTLGLIITFIMAIMIGCRLKMVRRRVRRGKSYAHDADYLVNGMYL